MFVCFLCYVYGVPVRILWWSTMAERWPTELNRTHKQPHSRSLGRLVSSDWVLNMLNKPGISPIGEPVNQNYWRIGTFRSRSWVVRGIVLLCCVQSFSWGFYPKQQKWIWFVRHLAQGGLMTVDIGDRTLNLSAGGQTTPSLRCSVVQALRFPISCRLFIAKKIFHGWFFN